MKVAWGLLICFLLVWLAVAFTTPPIRMVDVSNGPLSVRHYYDYRKDVEVMTYIAEMRDGVPTGKLYAVELYSAGKYSRNRMIQFSDLNVRDSNSGTMIRTIPNNDLESERYRRLFAEVRGLHEQQKWWERITYPW